MNVSRVYRLLKLITLLRSGRPMDADALAESLKVSRRTLFRDLNLLEHAGVPYTFEHNKNTYSIADSFFLQALHLSMEESLALLLVTRKFLSKQVHPLYQQALEAALKIESNLPAPVLEYCGKWLEGLSVRWSPSSSAEAISKPFEMLQHAVAHRVRLQMKYDSVYDKNEIDVTVDPLRIVFISRGWYFLAYSLEHKQVRLFKVDRIVDLKTTQETFTPPPDFSEASYFGKAWRMIPDGVIHKVKLRFCAEVAASVEEVQWHPTQTTTRLPDGKLLFEADVDGLREISPWVLSYGPQVEILAPRELRELLKERAHEIMALAEKVGQEEGAA